MKHISNYSGSHIDSEKISFIYLRCFDVDLWPVNPIIHIVYV